MNINKATASQKRTLCCVLVFMISTTLSACSLEDRDKEIKADIASKAKSDINFAGVNFTVQDSKVTLTGSCPTLKARAGVDQSLKTIHVLKSVDNRIKISPVTLGASYAVKQAVDSILAGYPRVNAEVTDSAVVLIGSVKKEESTKLLADIKKIGGGTLVNQMTIN
jgi:osmotically-inducible protein OsmY